MGQQGQKVPTGILGQGTPKRQRPTHQVNQIFISFDLDFKRDLHLWDLWV